MRKPRRKGAEEFVTGTVGADHLHRHRRQGERQAIAVAIGDPLPTCLESRPAAGEPPDTGLGVPRQRAHLSPETPNG